MRVHEITGGMSRASEPAVVAAGARGGRLHGLDAVRAGALLLGIVLHALMPFAAEIPWMVTDARRAHWPIAVISAIHLFRMTLFMVMAGYFGRIVCRRRGARGYLLDRIKRIGLPAFAFWPVAVMPLGLLAVWHASRVGVAVVRPDLPGGRQLPEFNLGHLWFLWVLLQCVVVTLAVRAVVRRFAPDLAERVAGRVARWLVVPGGVVLATVPYAITTNLQRDASGVVSPTTVMPDPVALVAHLGAFAVGWVLAHDRGALARLGGQAWGHFAVAVVAVAAALVTTQAIPIGVRVPQPVWSTLLALAGWTSAYALVGLAIRYLTTERGWIRYLADASYWMYLMHLVVLTLFEVMLAPLGWPVPVKLVTNLGLTTVILLVSYHLLVRSSWLGGWLNGHRRPRHRLGRRGFVGGGQ